MSIGSSVSSVDQMMAQMRLMAAQAGNQSAVVPTNQSGAFSELLQSSLDKVNVLQKTGNSMAKSFELGSEEFSLAEVMIAKQKSSIAFQATVQVRNKLLEAYKDVMSMSV
ncbi:MAG: flagellar hook-basal body complex protein FliE [Gammaproteobacteria bacterium]|nr:flagellar hook-basal body complex protein FliE [Gammaproteobacteria bacterium]